ncbi:MAG: hypothetical protein HOH66_10135 [Rhodospirillaceae bacterium]|jgi:hypothetical protein|nr:hypothetical protein [Rhodospirillaceae bacterium]MBT6118213.1 hypothetical protein [Rhodospirillaceae bacterium]
MTVTPNPKWAHLEAQGEVVIRQKLALQQLGGLDMFLAREWLEYRANQRLDSSSREQIRIARSAKIAAWIAAIAAIIAAISAIIALAPWTLNWGAILGRLS